MRNLEYETSGKTPNFYKTNLCGTNKNYNVNN